MRKTILNAGMIEQFCAAVGLGMPERYASEMIGVPYSTVGMWKVAALRARDKKNSKRTANDALYLLFLEQLEKARSYARLQRVKVIQKAADGGAWQAAAWWLERMCPESFGRPYVALKGRETDTNEVVQIIIDGALVPGRSAS